MEFIITRVVCVVIVLLPYLLCSITTLTHHVYVSHFMLVIRGSWLVNLVHRNEAVLYSVTHLWQPFRVLYTYPVVYISFYMHAYNVVLLCRVRLSHLCFLFFFACVRAVVENTHKLTSDDQFNRKRRGEECHHTQKTQRIEKEMQIINHDIWCCMLFDCELRTRPL